MASTKSSLPHQVLGDMLGGNPWLGVHDIFCTKRATLNRLYCLVKW